jgi:hypothetical protein
VKKGKRKVKKVHPRKLIENQTIHAPQYQMLNKANLF